MTRRTRRRLGWLAVAALVGAAIWWLTRTESGDWHPSTLRYPRQGIDVSHHQGTIRWALLPNTGVDFAYIKATEGIDYRDPMFAENWAGAKAAGIERGAYHFFSLCRPGAEQAANFIAMVPRAPDALPPAIDLEYLGNCDTPVTVAAFHRELGIFIRLVEQRYHQPVVLYLTAEFDRTYQVSARVNRPLWLRSILTEPDFGAPLGAVASIEFPSSSRYRRTRRLERRTPLMRPLTARRPPRIRKSPIDHPEAPIHVHFVRPLDS